MTVPTDGEILIGEPSMSEQTKGLGRLDPHGDSQSLLVTLTYLVARRRLLYKLVTAALTLAVLHSLLFPRRYTARTTFTPEPELEALQASGSLTSLAARFGITGRLGMTPLSFYPELIGTEAFLNRLVLTSLPVSPRGDSVRSEDSSIIRQIRLIDLYTQPSDSMPIRERRARTKVWSHTSAAVNQDANTVTIEFTADQPQTAAAVANAYVALVNEFNVTQRRSHAKSLRAFLEQEAIPRAAVELQRSEDSLAAFYVRNRTFATSPTLRLEEERLQRRISLKQESYMTLESELERTRVEEIRDTPVMTIVSPGIAPVKPSSPLWYIDLPVATLLAVATWVMWVLFHQYSILLRRTEPRALAALKAELQRAVPFLHTAPSRPRK